MFKQTFNYGYMHMGHLNEPRYGLIEGHAYSIMGVHELMDDKK
jgi:hypothetical protein